MQLLSQDLAVHAFTPADGSQSAAIKLVHRVTQQQVVVDQTPSQVDNLRKAIKKLITSMNPNPDLIPLPDLLPFDKVKISLPQTTHDGEITKINWDFKTNEWKYYVESPKEVVTNWYVAADLQLRDN
jgi:hypothetical protein